MSKTATIANSRVVRTGSLCVDAPPDLAFMLFTGPGEALWIDGWEPAVLGGDGLSRGTVFSTDIGEDTLWIVVDFDRHARHARYARFAHGSRAGTVEVRVEPGDKGGSIAYVTYELTALSADGNQALDAFDETEYADMLQTWERMIRDADIDYESAFFGGH